VKLWKELGVL